jgi:FkbM family methyltransferase
MSEGVEEMTMAAEDVASERRSAVGGRASEGFLGRPEGGALVRAPWTAIDAAMQDEVDEYFEAGARIEPGDVVLDVGANVGAFAMRAAERTGGRVTVHCFEPAPEVFARLEENRRSHPTLRSATTTLNRVALTSPEHAGHERPFYYFSRIPTNSTYDLADKRAEYEAYFFGKARRIEAWLALFVPLVGALLGRLVRAVIELACRRDNRLHVWIADHATGLRVMRCQTESLERWAAQRGVDRVDLLKIDVEGAELDVLEGCGALWPRIRSVALETHERGGRVAIIEQMLAARGFGPVRQLSTKITEQTGLDNVLLVAHRASEVRS